MQQYTGTPSVLANAGTGIPWQLPENATAGGIGSATAATIESVAISGNVATFTTVNQPTPFVAGQAVVIANMVVNTFLNNVTLVVLATGLSATQFSANFTHADLASTSDAGTATPTTAFAFAQNIDGAYTPGPGQYVTYAMIEGPWSGGGVFTANQLNLPCCYQAHGQEASGYGGASVGEPTISTISPSAPVPTMPPGANIVGIYAVALASKDTSGGGLVDLTAYMSDGTNYPFVMTGSWERSGPLSSTNLSVLTSSYFQLSVYSSNYESGAYWGSVTAVGFAIVYDFPGGGTPVPANQLQTLEGTNCGFSTPPNTVAAGIEVTLNTGIAYGTTCTLDVQLTLAGTPVGTPKTITVGPWSSSYVLGGPADIWGLVGLRGNQISGSNGLGVNVSGTLADNTQVNLNSLQATAFVNIARPRVWVRIGTTRIPQ